MSSIRVLIADDHPLIVEGLTSALHRHGIDVVTHVTVASEVTTAYANAKANVLVLDIRFGDGSSTGLDVAHELLAIHPEARIVFYSQFDADEQISEAYRLGGAAFVPKSASASVLADAIKQVHTGKRYFLPTIAERLALIGIQGDESPQSKLDARALEVFKLMAQGRTNVEIADQQGVSLKTISTITQHIKERLGIERPAEITRLAIKHMVISP